jgi:hypothetical protein
MYYLCKVVDIVKSGDTRRGGGDREMQIEHLRSLQLSRKKRDGGLYWPGPQQLPVHTPQITMEIYISDWIHKFQNKTGLDAKANLELYKFKRVCSASFFYFCPNQQRVLHLNYRCAYTR